MPYAGAVVLISIASVLFFIIALATHHRLKREAAWQQVASELDLKFFTGSWTSGPAISGTVRGFFISVDIQGTNEDRVTRYSVGYPSTGQQDIALTKESSFHFTLVKRLMAKNDVEIGDPEFDDRVLIDAPDRVEAARYLSPVRRQTVLRLFSHQPFRNQKVTDTSVVVDTLGIESDAENLRRTISVLLDAAHTMSAPTDVDVTSETVETVEVVEEPLPPQDVVVADTQPPQDHVAATVQTEQPLALDQDSVINDLFESGRMGFDTDEHFQTTYSGASIRWTGEVDSIRGYRNDSDFEGAGIRATVLLRAVGTDAVGTGAVGTPVMRSRMTKAIVQLAQDSVIERGQEVAFEGTLFRADRFTRRLFIANAAMGVANGTIDT